MISNRLTGREGSSVGPSPDTSRSPSNPGTGRLTTQRQTRKVGPEHRLRTARRRGQRRQESRSLGGGLLTKFYLKADNDNHVIAFDLTVERMRCVAFSSACRPGPRNRAACHTTSGVDSNASRELLRKRGTVSASRYKSDTKVVRNTSPKIHQMARSRPSRHGHSTPSSASLSMREATKTLHPSSHSPETSSSSNPSAKPFLIYSGWENLGLPSYSITHGHCYYENSNRAAPSRLALENSSGSPMRLYLIAQSGV